ncbi:hypothetical protein JCM6882_007960 [Rhodosporidiobolus microsporus]
MLKRITSRSSVASDRPPSYRTVDAAPSTSAAPPPFSPSAPPTFPSTYTVGAHEASFVSVEQLKQHLLLLAAFKRLRERVEAEVDPPDAPKKLRPETRWAVFVAMAVWRWELFLTKVVAQGATKHGLRPPLDVALVWHTYQLNPVRWEEDTLRLFPRLKDLKGQLLRRFTKSINPETLEQSVPTKAAAEWEVRTGTKYDPLEHYRQTKGRPITVPLADGVETELFVPWVASDGTGYAQEEFSTPSEVYYAPWTHASLGVYKLVKDIVACRTDSSATLAGSVVAPDCTPAKPSDSRRARLVRRLIVAEKYDIQPAQSAYDLGHKMNWRKGGGWLIVWRALGLKNKDAMRHILSCYTRGEPFSLDLASAVLRQGTFIDKMHSFGWLDTGRFDNDETTLNRCIARYHGFMDLLSNKNTMFCVPTLDIDLAWHAHQLLYSYKNDMVKHARRFIDHNDKVEEGTLSNAFELTALEWQKRFGVPYTTCGCPLPPPPSDRSLLNILGITSPPSPPPLSPFSASLLPSDSESSSATEATHPSEHNSLLLPAHAEVTKLRDQRRTSLESRRRKEEKQAEREDKQAEREEQRRQRRAARMTLPPIEEKEKGEKSKLLGGKEDTKEVEAPPLPQPRRYGPAGDPAHNAAFFAPVPLEAIYGPSGYPTPIGGCANSNANISGKYSVDSGSVPHAACIGGANIGACVNASGSCASCMPTPSARSSSGYSGGGSSAGCGGGGCG